MPERYSVSHGPRTNVQYRPRPRPGHSGLMVAWYHRRRRTLRSSGLDGLTEGVLVSDHPHRHQTVEIAGGPPRAVAAVRIAGEARHHVELDGCGTGRITLIDCQPGERVDVMIDGLVLLTGHLPTAAGTADR